MATPICKDCGVNVIEKKSVRKDFHSFMKAQGFGPTTTDAMWCLFLWLKDNGYITKV